MEWQALRDAMVRYNAEAWTACTTVPDPAPSPAPHSLSFSHRLLNSYEDIVDALCTAWNKLSVTTLASLTGYPYLNQVSF